MKLIRLFSTLIFLVNFQSKGDENKEYLKKFRLRRIHQTDKVIDAHLDFIKKTKAIMAAPIEATPEKVMPYEDSRAKVKKALPKSEKFEEAICNDKELIEAEAAFAAQRKQFAEMLAAKERTTRLISIVSELLSNLQATMEPLEHAFEKNCGLDEQCLSKKQDLRLQQINATAITHWNLLHVRKLIPEFADSESQEELKNVTSTAITNLANDLESQFDNLASRNDLPW